ncbi:MAG: endonuclease III, partial [Candidatus Binatia bacterium]|nr:endonuclease III [Candidatus Binatia bacterium]
IEFNDLLVSFGQHLCRPISPVCSQCPIAKYCSRVGVSVKR